MGAGALALTPKGVFAASSASFSPLISIGYAPALPANGASVRIGDAAMLDLPDPAFISRGARVTVVGSLRGAKYLGQPGGIGVDALMPVLSRAAANFPHFRFWSAGGDSVTGNVGFTMPAVATSGLNFVARKIKQTTKKEETSATPPADVDPAPFTLSLSSGPGPKLQRGVYVVALRESVNDTFSDWSGFRIAASNGAYSVPGAGFAWVILKIDYAIQ